MSRDIEVLVTLDGKYADEKRSTALRLTMAEHSLSESAVRGMASRARRSVEGRVALLNYHANNVPSESPSEREVRNLVRSGMSMFARFQGGLETGMTYRAVFASDIHFPAHDPAHMQLFYEVVNDLQNVAYVSTLNDAFDFARLSHWQDRRRIDEQRFDADISNALRMHDVHMGTLRQVAPNALYVAVCGNHDKRVFANYAERSTTPYAAAKYVNDLHEQGVMFVSTPDTENIVAINDGLMWYHGSNTSINRKTAAVKNYQTVKRETERAYDFDLVFGHTHWQGATPVPNTNGTVYNAGHLCAKRQHYLRRAPDWRAGFAFSMFEPRSNWSRTLLVPFERNNGRLVAYVDGKTYSVPIE